jgi:formamidopyrimidine-DNA glycosylase
MPELPEVQTVVTTLRPRLLGARVKSVTLFRTDIVRPENFDLAAHLSGRKVSDIVRRGKKILFLMDDGGRFYIHLGMSGRLTLDEPGSARKNHTHLVIDIAGAELRFVDPRRFGGIFWLGVDDSIDAGMGPEPLSMRPAQLLSRLRRTKRVVKNALLDQLVVAGLGNIYVDEALFAAGIHPTRRADTLTANQVAKLNRSIKLVLRRALKHRGSTLRDYRDGNGEPGNFQKLHRVYGREGLACWKCGTPLQRIVLGGRSSHFCPRCQPNGQTEK